MITRRREATRTARSKTGCREYQAVPGGRSWAILADVAGHSGDPGLAAEDAVGRSSPVAARAILPPS